MYLKRLGVVALALFLVFGMLFPMPALAAEASEDLYRTIVKDIMAEHGGLWFDESSYECSARGVFKIDLLDFNGDGTDELVMLYNREEDGIFPIVEVWTVEDGKAVQVFSEKTQEESHEAIINFSLYQNDGKLYVPVYDSLDHSPMYVHLYGLDGNGEFREIYQYENNDFYMNQLPDGREFTQFNAVQYYICDRADNYEACKIKMETTLRQEMDKAMGRMTSAYDYGNWGNDRWTSQWGWYREGTDMCAMLALKATDESTLSGDITFYRSFMEQLTITKTGNTGTVTSEFGNFTGTAHFGTGYICLHFEDRMMPDSSSTLSEMLGTTVFCFCLLSSDPDTQTAVSWDPYMNRLQSGFDRTSMLGEWTMAPSQPNTNRHLIRLEPDGTMGFRAEDGSWHDCIYTMDETYFYYVYEETGIVSGGEYTVSGNTLILGGEAEAEPEQELSAYECQGDWAWKDEYGTERGAITLSAESSRRLLGDICLYRRTNVNYSLEIELDGTRGTISSESGVIKGTAEFGEDEIWFYLEDKTLSDGTTISEAFETTSFCFTRSNSEPKEFIKKYDTAVYYSDSLFLGSPSQYNYELAKLGGILSCAAEKSEKELVELLEKIGVCDYHTENFGPLSSFAFAFAYKEMNLDGQDTAVLFIIARGTTNFWEGLADASPFTTSFYGYEAYATPYSFYAQVNNALTKYLEEIDLEPGAYPLKVFVTGHSLGGACANLVAAQFNLDKKWKNSLTPNEDGMHGVSRRTATLKMKSR